MKFVIEIEDSLLEWAIKEYDLIDDKRIAAEEILRDSDTWTFGEEVKIVSKGE